MTNALTKVSNGRIANNVLNVIANTAGMIASAVAISTGSELPNVVFGGR
tara:strand:- start:130 stop:276 length:147 start_codon:yes stop_codon:yes gene_type:complete